MRAPPIVRSAHFVARTDLMRSVSSFAKQKAKQMMGNGNPNTGAEIRKPASTSCPSCHRWHRPGVVCPNTKKSMPLEPLFRSHGEYTIQQPPAQDPRQMMQSEGMMMPVDPAPQPVAMQGAHGLLNYQPVAAPPATPQEQQEQLMNTSVHIQGQNQDYMDALRNWQTKYGGQ